MADHCYASGCAPGRATSRIGGLDHLNQRDTPLTRQNWHGLSPETTECTVPSRLAAASPWPTNGRNCPTSGDTRHSKGVLTHIWRPGRARNNHSGHEPAAVRQLHGVQLPQRRAPCLAGPRGPPRSVDQRLRPWAGLTPPAGASHRQAGSPLAMAKTQRAPATSPEHSFSSNSDCTLRTASSAPRGTGR